MSGDDACVTYSATGTRTRVFRVRAEPPNQLDYGGSAHPTHPDDHVECYRSNRNRVPRNDEKGNKHTNTEKETETQRDIDRDKDRGRDRGRNRDRNRNGNRNIDGKRDRKDDGGGDDDDDDDDDDNTNPTATTKTTTNMHYKKRKFNDPETM